MSNIHDSQSQLNDIYDALNTQIRQQVPENIFVNYFLRYFAGMTPISENNKIISEWISIAGTPTSEVDIIDISGKVLYSVPSLYSTTCIDVNKSSQSSSIDAVYDEYALRNNNIPSAAQTFLNQALEQKLQDMSVTPDITDDKRRWDDIFTRYNIKPKELQSQQQTEFDDDLIFE